MPLKDWHFASEPWDIILDPLLWNYVKTTALFSILRGKLWQIGCLQVLFGPHALLDLIPTSSLDTVVAAGRAVVEIYILHYKIPSEPPHALSGLLCCFPNSDHSSGSWKDMDFITDSSLLLLLLLSLSWQKLRYICTCRLLFTSGYSSHWEEVLFNIMFHLSPRRLGYFMGTTNTDRSSGEKYSASSANLVIEFV